MTLLTALELANNYPADISITTHQNKETGKFLVLVHRLRDGAIHKLMLSSEYVFDSEESAKDSTLKIVWDCRIKYCGVRVLIDVPRFKGCCHLVASTLEDLHAFAKDIGLREGSFHNRRKKNRPHYDVKESLLQRAIEFGAFQVSPQDLVRFLKANYSDRNS